jgi:hypothetical protein
MELVKMKGKRKEASIDTLADPHRVAAKDPLVMGVREAERGRAGTERGAPQGPGATKSYVY